MQNDFPLGWFAQKEMTNDGEKDRGKENKSQKTEVGLCVLLNQWCLTVQNWTPYCTCTTGASLKQHLLHCLSCKRLLSPGDVEPKAIFFPWKQIRMDFFVYQNLWWGESYPSNTHNWLIAVKTVSMTLCFRHITTEDHLKGADTQTVVHPIRFPTVKQSCGSCWDPGWEMITWSKPEFLLFLSPEVPRSLSCDEMKYLAF